MISLAEFQEQEDPRSRDALIAQHVMGLNPIKRMWCYADPEVGGLWNIEPFQNDPGWEPSPYHEMVEQHPCWCRHPNLVEPQGWEAIPFYTTRLQDAWEVVEKLACEHFLPDYRLFRSQNVWEAHFVGVGPDGSLDGVGEGDTPAYAICEAAIHLTEQQAYLNQEK